MGPWGLPRPGERLPVLLRHTLPQVCLPRQVCPFSRDLASTPCPLVCCSMETWRLSVASSWPGWVPLLRGLSSAVDTYSPTCFLPQVPPESTERAPL